MYKKHQPPIIVHDAPARYGPEPHPPGDFLGAGILHDLEGAHPDEMLLILARYAALRAWVLNARGADRPGGEYARTAALEYLAATDPAWEERELLSAALEAGDSPRGLRLLDAAARAADSMGHGHGARAIRAAMDGARWWKAWFRPPSSS